VHDATEHERSRAQLDSAVHTCRGTSSFRLARRASRVTRCPGARGGSSACEDDSGGGKLACPRRGKRGTHTSEHAREMAKLDSQRLIFGAFLMIPIILAEVVFGHLKLPAWPAFLAM